jgi:hypothetical protein
MINSWISNEFIYRATTMPIPIAPPSPVSPVPSVSPIPPASPVSPVPSVSPIPPASLSISVTSQSPLDGSAQFTVLGLLLAVIVYIRNIPAKELNEARKKWESSPESDKKKGKLRKIYFQSITLNIFQIVLVGLSVLVAGRSVWWGSALDNIILWSLFVFAFLFLIFHIWINGDLIRIAINSWRNLQ